MNLRRARALRRALAGGLLLAAGLLGPAGLRAGSDAWGESVRVDGPVELAGAVDLEAEGGRRWAAWSAGDHIRVAQRDAAGPWEPGERVATGHAPDLVLDEQGRPHLAFVNEIDGRQDIFYSLRGELGWALPRNVSDTLAISGAPSLALEGETRHLAWSDGGRLYLGRSEDGDRWSIGPVLINGSAIQGRDPILRVAPEGGLDLIWQAGAEAAGEIRHARRSAGVWSLPEILVAPGQRGRNARLVVAADGQRHLVWRDAEEGLRWLQGQPGLWDWPEPVAEGEILGAPSLALRPAGLDLAWTRVDGAEAGLRYRWRAAGAGWQAERGLAAADQQPEDPAIAADEGLPSLVFVADAAGGRELRALDKPADAPVAPSPTPFGTSTPTVTSEPTSGSSPEPGVSPTVEPGPSETAISTSTASPGPSATRTPTSEPTGTLVPSTPTGMARPSATSTLEPPQRTPTDDADALGRRILLPFLITRRAGGSDFASPAGRAPITSSMQPWTGDASSLKGADARIASGDPATTTASAPAIAERPEMPFAMSLVVDAVGAPHALWEEAGRILHSRRTAGGGWSEARRVATGSEPVASLAADGGLHLLIANTFDGNGEIYHLRWDAEAEGWGLPVNVSQTEAFSVAPALIDGSPERPLLAAWTELRAAGPLVHQAYWQAGRWHHAPVLQARGQGAALARAGQRAFLAWHERASRQEPFAVYGMPLEPEALPEAISEAEGQEATAAALHATADGLLHAAWTESRPDDRALQYSRRIGERWDRVQTLAEQGAEAPRMLPGADRPPVLVWPDGARIWLARGQGEFRWHISAPAPSEPAGRLGPVAAARDAAGGVHLVWSEPAGVGAMLRYAQVVDVPPAPECQVSCAYLPLLLGGR